jgi:energy-coupling factor transport system permease protein
MALAGIVVLAGVSAFLVWVACSQWRFYPTMPTLVAWWGYIPFAAFVALPSVLALVERASWRFA